MVFNSIYAYEIEDKDVTLPLRNEISSYVHGTLQKEISTISFENYLDFAIVGRPDSFEKIYFDR